MIDAKKGGVAPGASQNRLAVAPSNARNQTEARRVMNEEYPFKCCVVCGLQLAACLQVAHLNHNAGDNSPENLARLCPTHHGMFDAGLYPVEAIRMMQDHWQVRKGNPDHKPRMKDAGVKAALARKRSATAKKAVATRQQNLRREAGTT